MGYTHYWNKMSEKCDEEKYKAALADIKKIVDANKKILAGGLGDIGTSPITDKGITFNGIESEGHETFFLPPTFKELEKFTFCKTARKEYDKVVVAALTVLHNYLNETFVQISSDGDREELVEGLDLAKQILNKNLVHILDPVPNSIELLKTIKKKTKKAEKSYVVFSMADGEDTEIVKVVKKPELKDYLQELIDSRRDYSVYELGKKINK